MADSIVENAVKFSLQNLLRLLADEVNLPSGVKAKIKSLSKELEYMDVFLKKAKGKHEDELVKEVVNPIRDVAYEAEDVADTYVANVTLQRIRNMFNQLLRCLCLEVMLHDNDVDAKLESIKRSIDEIYKNKDKYSIGEGEVQSERGVEEEPVKSLRKRGRDVEEEEVVGLVHDSTFNIEELKAEDSSFREVGLYAEPNSPSPNGLPCPKEEESWKQLCDKVFCEKECPDYLGRLGREMVESCKGLPLAIGVLAGLVAKKEKSKREWERIMGSINPNLAEDKIVEDILKLSYDNLPRELKPCFLYLGIYPEDYEIPVRELTRLWVVEGFIQPEGIGTSNPREPEDVADDYLHELVDRSLVQVASKRSDGGVKTCRIHYLLRELCLSESKKIKFMEVSDGLNIGKCSSRRLSLHCKLLSPKEYSQSHTRSLFLFGNGSWYHLSEGWEWIRNSLKLARVLYLDEVNLGSLGPMGFNTLIHLRYLKIGVRPESVGNIFASMCNLWNLETLILPACRWGACVTIPSGMWKLKRLRHVIVERGLTVNPPARNPKGENSETGVSLQTLGEVRVSPELVLMMNNDFFPNLTKLSVLYEKSSPQQLPSLHHLNKLRKLKIIGLELNLPSDANVFPPNLTKITLRDFECGLDFGFMNTLGQLPKLQILKLNRGKLSGSIICVAGSFPKLEVFQMRDLRVKGQWRQEKGALPCLRRFSVCRCEYLDEQENNYYLLRNPQ